MSALLDRIDGWWLRPAPALRPAIVRILVGAYCMVLVGARSVQDIAIVEMAPSRFDPVGIVGVLSRPIDSGLAIAAIVATAALSIAFTVGYRYRFTGPAFALLLLWVTTYRNSWGHVAHGDNLAVLHVLAISIAPAADALSLDARAGRTRSTGWSAGYGWPLRLMALTTVLTYLLAGWAKIRYGGEAWLGGEAVRLQIAYDALRKARLGGTQSGLAALLLPHAWVFAPAGLGTIIVECGAPLALLNRKLRVAWTLSMWLLHVGIAGIMAISFTYPLSLVAFSPLYRVERIAARIRRRWRRRKGPPRPSTDQETA